jgi:hypothetical protein
MAVVSRPIKPVPAERTARAGRRKAHPLFTVVAYGLALLALVVLLQQGLIWAQRTIDNVRYGFPRSVTIDGFVGHGESHGEPTRIITLNNHGQISILELPGGDTSRLTVLQGPYLVGRDGVYVVPKPQLRDINDDGHVDLLVTVRDEILVYLNKEGAFHALTPEERAGLVEEGSLR